jgi:hypothetical protein
MLMHEPPALPTFVLSKQVALMKSSLALSLLASAYAAPCPDCKPIAGYKPYSDVTAHQKVDLDLNDMASGMATGTYASRVAAATKYSLGGSSKKSSGGIRTIQGFSTAALAKMKGQNYFSKYLAYHGGKSQHGRYADTFVRAALDGTIAPGSEIARKEMAVKGASYQVIWMYVLRELEDAIHDCRIGDLSSNDDQVHAWDEAWAFYVGSQEGIKKGGDKASAGNMPYRLAEKRAANFKTTDPATGFSNVNTELLELFEKGRDELLEPDCNEAAKIMAKIKSKMTVPLVQGALRYAFKSDPSVTDQLITPKNVAEVRVAV